jgi:hypothetical protein
MEDGIVRGEDNTPEVLRGHTPDSRLYSSIIKFSPKGGAAWHLSEEEYVKNFSFRPPRLGLKQEKVTMITYGIKKIKKNSILEGAEWWRPGFSCYLIGVCHCRGHLFDTDDFGRTFYPDALRSRVAILDAAGNEILHLGSYGNCDNRGPHSWVRDPETGRLRPRKDSDPESLVSPYAEPEFAFAYLNSVAVSDRHIYALDAMNNRVMKIRMDYQADETCAVK